MESGTQKQVCLRRNYCEWCFKGKLGKSNGVWVSTDSECIDTVQLMHTKHNGLLPLDMENPGTGISQNCHKCGIVCLVCGLNIVSEHDSRFDGLKELVESYRMEWLEFRGEVQEGHMRFLAVSLEKSLNLRMQKSFGKFNAVWIDQWERLVHTGCAVQTLCNCAIPIGETICKRHKKGLKVKVPVKLPSIKRKAPEATVQSKPQPQQAVIVVSLPTTSGLKQSIKGMVVTKATWLKPLSTTAKSVGSGSSSSSGNASGKYAEIKQKNKPKPSKLNLKLQDAAKGCSFKIEAWAPPPLLLMNSAGIEGKGCSGTGIIKKAKFSMEEHQQKFDPYIHGYVWGKDGRMWYVRGDGVRVRAECGVNEFTEDGELLPLC